MCPSTRVVPHHLPADRICSKLPANRHLWHVHAGQDVVHEKGLTLLTVRDFDRVITARVPRHGPVDIFAPKVVVWAYEGPPQRALRALLDLVHPAHPDAPTTAYPAPARLHVPRAQQRPMTIQPPSRGRVRVRATRLAAG